jgi:hypothetical protein
MLKKHLFYLFIFGIISHSFSQNTTIPEKWNNESAVYLSKNVHYTYNRPRNSIEFNRVIKEKVLLLDQAAVTNFSELSYEKDNSYISYGTSRVTSTYDLKIKIIKPDGNIVRVNTKETLEGKDKKKLAIPNLEKGDIIDYEFQMNVIMGENDLYRYKPVELLIKDDYPILDYKFILDTEDDFFIAFNSYNGAPELKDVSPKAKKKRHRKRVYTFELKDVEKNKSNRWLYPYAELPCVKFQVNFARTGKYEKRAYAFIPKEASIIKKTVEKEDVLNLYQDKFAPKGDLGKIKRFLKKRSFKSDEEKVKAVFYFIRHAFFTRYIEAWVADDADIIYPYSYYGDAIFFKEEEQFVKYFAAFLKDHKIDYEIIIGTKRYNGKIEELLLESNVDYLLKVNTKNPIYIESFDHLTTVNLIDPLLEGADAYALEVIKRKNIEGIKTITLPITTIEDNKVVEKIDLTIADGFSALNIEKHSIYSGQTKRPEQRQRLNFYDYVYDEYKKFGTLSLSDRIKKKKLKADFDKKFKAIKEKMAVKQKERLEKRTASEYDFEIENYDFEILKNGRYGIDDDFELKESFTIPDDLLSKAGKNYILQVGKLIGDQVELEDKEAQRDTNIYMRYARSFADEITITIPEGYTVAGLDKLNKKVINETGGFETSASLEGNILTIHAKKHYNKNFEPKENWSKMTDFLEAAFQFTQEKILIKKL